MLAFYTLNTKILSIKNLFNSVKWLSITPKAMCQVIYIYKIDNKWLPLWLSWYRICLQCGRPGFDPWVGKIPWRRERLPIPVSWSGECCGLYSPRGHRESDKTERLLLTIINGQGTSLVVQWFRLSAYHAGGTGSIPGRGTKIPHATWCGQKIKNRITPLKN